MYMSILQADNKIDHSHQKGRSNPVFPKQTLSKREWSKWSWCSGGQKRWWDEWSKQMISCWREISRERNKMGSSNWDPKKDESRDEDSQCDFRILRMRCEKIAFASHFYWPKKSHRVRIFVRKIALSHYSHFRNMRFSRLFRRSRRSIFSWLIFCF